MIHAWKIEAIFRNINEHCWKNRPHMFSRGFFFILLSTLLYERSLATHPILEMYSRSQDDHLRQILVCSTFSSEFNSNPWTRVKLVGYHFLRPCRHKNKSPTPVYSSLNFWKCAILVDFSHDKPSLALDSLFADVGLIGPVRVRGRVSLFWGAVYWLPI